MILENMTDEQLLNSIQEQGWSSLNWVDGYEPFRLDRSRCGETIYRPEVLQFLHSFVPEESRIITLDCSLNMAGIKATKFRLDLGPVARWRVLRGYPIEIDPAFPLCRVAVFSGGCPHKICIFPTGVNFEYLYAVRQSEWGELIGYRY